MKIETMTEAELKAVLPETADPAVTNIEVGPKLNRKERRRLHKLAGLPMSRSSDKWNETMATRLKQR